MAVNQWGSVLQVQPKNAKDCLGWWGCKLSLGAHLKSQPSSKAQSLNLDQSTLTWVQCMIAIIDIFHIGVGRIYGASYRWAHWVLPTKMERLKQRSLDFTNKHEIQQHATTNMNNGNDIADIMHASFLQYLFLLPRNKEEQPSHLCVHDPPILVVTSFLPPLHPPYLCSLSMTSLLNPNSRVLQIWIQRWIHPNELAAHYGIMVLLHPSALASKIISHHQPNKQ